VAKPKTGTKPDEFLRARAKKILTKTGQDLGNIPPTEIQKLVHELQIHQVELDMQNEELRRAQGEAEAAGAKYADLFDCAPIGYFIFDQRGVILDTNLTGARLLGVERGSLLSTQFLSRVAPAFQPGFTAHLQKVFASKARQSCTLQLATQAGPALQVAMESVAAEGPASGLTQCRSAFIDITARKLAEETLKASEASYRAIFDSANDAIFIHDAGTFAILDVNRKMEEMFGYTAEEARNLLVGQISSGQPPYTQDEALTRLRQAAAGEPQMFEWLCQDKNSRLFWVEVSLKRAVIGGQDRILAIVRDNTARKQAEEEINTTIAFLENIIASSVDPIAIVDEHGRFTKWNQAAAEAYGCSAEGLAGQTAFDLYADKNATDKMLGQLRREGFVRGYEIDMRKKDGTIAPFSLSIGLFGDEAGKSIGSVCVARDLSETRKSMAELSLVNAKLQGLVEEADKRNRELTIINSMAEKLQSCLSLDEAYPLIAQHAQGLFPARSGALFIQDPSTNLMEAVSTWGDALAGEPAFPPTDCWGLRRGRENLTGGLRRETRCRHVPHLQPGNYLCLPLLVHRETLGLLHVQDLADLTGERAEPLQTLAVTIGDHISLALANIRLRETLRHQVIHDALTGLFNRRYLEETLEREIHRVRRKGASLGIIMLDLDRFKHFNDTYGHEAGDNLLRALGKCLASRVRKEDVACRYGGEEFVLILPEASQKIVRQRAEEIRRGFPKVPVVHRGQVLESVTVSLGVAMFPEHGATGQDVLRAADDAMYRAKAQGRHRVVVAESGVHHVPDNLPKPELVKR
jgi:diguanylate cyclase (GGDEF)-like protein/PAS domain S-box-containing protein